MSQRKVQHCDLFGSLLYLLLLFCFSFAVETVIANCEWQGQSFSTLQSRNCQLSFQNRTFAWNHYHLFCILAIDHSAEQPLTLWSFSSNVHFYHGEWAKNNDTHLRSKNKSHNEKWVIIIISKCEFGVFGWRRWATS